MGHFHPKEFIKKSKNTEVTILLDQERFRQEFGEFEEFFEDEETIGIVIFSLGSILSKISQPDPLNLEDKALKVALFAMNLIPAESPHRKMLAGILLPYLALYSKTTLSRLQDWSNQTHVSTLPKELNAVCAIQSSLRECLNHPPKNKEVPYQEYLALHGMKHLFAAYQSGVFDSEAYLDTLSEARDLLRKQFPKQRKRVTAAFQQTKPPTIFTLNIPPLLLELNQGLSTYEQDYILQKNSSESKSLFYNSIYKNKHLITNLLELFKHSSQADFKFVTNTKLMLSMCAHMINKPELWDESEIKQMFQVVIYCQKALKQEPPIYFSMYHSLTPVSHELIVLIKQKQQPLASQIIQLPECLGDYLQKNKEVELESLSSQERFITAPFLRLKESTSDLAFKIKRALQQEVLSDKTGGLRFTYLSEAQRFFDYALAVSMKSGHEQARSLAQDLAHWAMFWEAMLAPGESIQSFDFKVFVAWLVSHLPQCTFEEAKEGHSFIKNHLDVAYNLKAIMELQHADANPQPRWENRIPLAKTIGHVCRALSQEVLNQEFDPKTLVLIHDVAEWFIGQESHIKALDHPMPIQSSFMKSVKQLMSSVQRLQEIHALHEKMAEYETRQDAFKQELAQQPSHDEMAKVGNELALVTAQHKKMQDKNAHITELNKHLEKKLKATKETLAHLESEKGSLEQDLLQKSKELVQSKERNHRLSQQQAKTCKTLEQERQHKDTLEQLLQKQTVAHQALTVQHQEQEQTIDELLKQLHLAKQLHKQERTKVTDLEQQVCELQETFSSLSFKDDQEPRDLLGQAAAVLTPQPSMIHETKHERYRTQQTISLPPHIVQLLEKLESESLHEAYLQGGWLRSTLTGTPPHDVDIITTCPREIVLSIPGFVENQYRANHFMHRQDKVDIKIVSTIDLKEIAEQSDLTINGLFANKHGHVYDPMDGLGALKNREFIVQGELQQTWNDDPVRILRLIRFHLELQWPLSDEHLYGAFEYLKNLHKRMPFGMYITHLKRLFTQSPTQAFLVCHHYELLGDLMALPSLNLKLRKHPEFINFWLFELNHYFKPTHQWITGLFMYLEVKTKMEQPGMEFSLACSNTIDEYLKRWNQEEALQQLLIEGLNISLKQFHSAYQEFMGNLTRAFNVYTPQFNQSTDDRDTPTLNLDDQQSPASLHTRNHHKNH